LIQSGELISTDFPITTKITRL